MNTEKMRRTLERSAEVREQDERRRWLNSLTPEHRAWHEGPRSGLPCGACVAIGLENINRRLESMRARRIAREAKRDA